MTASNTNDSSSSKVAMITGASGLLGRAMIEQLNQTGWRVVAFTHQQLDISNADAVEQGIAATRPLVIINCAATGDVDRCERDLDWAYAVNEKGPRYLARHARAGGAEIVHVSTDYVFDGG